MSRDPKRRRPGMARAGLLLLALPLLAAAPSPRPFITVSGTRFLEGDRPFHFVGANLNVMHEPTARARAGETIAALAGDGLRVGRLWALGEGEADAPQWLKDNYLFRAGPNGWQEAAFRQLDKVIAEAGKRGVRLIITLSNSWADYGGVFMYLRWAGHVDVETYGFTDRFFTDPRCRAWFLEHLRRVVGRTNSLTGIPYRDDPTIMAWELQNEMHGTPEGAADRRAWVVEMARAIKQIDPNHLVVPGLLGYNLQLERRDWVLMNQLPEVSFCDHHAYPEENLRTKSYPNLQRFIDDRVQLAHHVVKKPIIFGEFGYLDRGPRGRRERLHRLFLEHLFRDGASGGMVWIYQPTLPWKRTYGVIIDEAKHRPLRRTLGAIARRVATGEVKNLNPRLRPEQGDRPLAPTHVLLTQRFAPAGGWRRLGGRPEELEHPSAPAPVPGRMLLEVPVQHFQRARFEEAGYWGGGILVHAYGRRTGWYEYRFRGPGFVPARLELRTRLSSEFPGSSAPAHGFSQVKLLLDGKPLVTLRVPPDDGVGSWFSTVVTEPALLRQLRGGVHTLRLQVDEGPEANGVALFGRETELNREPVDDPGPIQILADRPAATARP